MPHATWFSPQSIHWVRKRVFMAVGWNVLAMVAHVFAVAPIAIANPSSLSYQNKSFLENFLWTYIPFFLATLAQFSLAYQVTAPPFPLSSP